MDARSFFVVVVKLFGLWVVYQTVTSLITLSFTGMGGAMILPVLVQLALGLFLIYGAKLLARIVGL